jgi:hypothetical protein
MIFNESNNKNIVNDDSIDFLCNDIESIGVSKEQINIHKNWVCIWFDPKIGLPEGITLPEGMDIPKVPCNLYIPS